MRADGLARHWRGTVGTLCLKPMVDEEECIKQQPAASTNVLNASVTAGSSTTAQARPMTPSYTGTTMPDWDDLLLQTSHATPNEFDEIFEYDDRLPVALYEQHPEITSLNWGFVLPE